MELLIEQQAQIEDAKEILTLQKLSYQSEAAIYHDDAIPPLKQTLAELKEDFTRQIFLKAVMDGHIVGSVRAYLKDGTCYIGRLVVHTEHQNQGIGSGLMRAIEEYFKEARRFELFTGHKSERNLYLYQKLGYKIFKTEAVAENLQFVYLEKYPAP